MKKHHLTIGLYITIFISLLTISLHELIFEESDASQILKAQVIHSTFILPHGGKELPH